MVYFVLNANGKQAICLDLQVFAAVVLVIAGDAGRAANIGVKTRHRQAAFLVFAVAFFANNARIDQQQRLVFVFANINHHQLLGDIHLHSSQPYALELVHSFQHICQQSGNASVKNADYFGVLPQPFVGKFQNF